MFHDLFAAKVLMTSVSTFFYNTGQSYGRAYRVLPMIALWRGL